MSDPMVKMKLMQFCFCLILVAGSALCRAAGPEEVHKFLENSVERASKTGIQTKKWVEERDLLIQELQNLELKDAWIRFQLERTQRYLLSEEKNLAILQENLAQAEKTQNTLAPFLEVLYLDLENHVKSDLPFAQEERSRRLAFIRSSLDDSGARLSEKFGRLLEAIQVESDYGYSVDVTQEIDYNIDGNASQVTVFRLGRLGLFRLFEANSRVQKYTRTAGEWQDISKTNIGELKKAMEIARKKRVTTVVELPVGIHSGDRQEGGQI
jgi:Protein of unknown function (DUF3450)